MKRRFLYKFIIICFGLFLIGCDPKPNEQVATPSASHAAGMVDIGTEVILSCATEGATIHYTLDGNTPTPNSDKYSTPIVISSNVTIKAIAAKSGMDNSEILTVDYSVSIIDDTIVDDNGSITVNGVSFDMVKVDGGIFTMGRTSEQPQPGDADWASWYNVEEPAHKVTLSDFSIGKTEVTQALWKAVMDNWPDDEGYPENENGLGDNYPMYCVNWEDIVGTDISAEAYTINGVTYYQNGFCYKLSQLAGGDKQFRLPTEAEWEYAARGGNKATSQTKYSGSNNVEEVGWCFIDIDNDLVDDNDNNSSHEVGKKKANALGLYDMSGNVLEWCSDWFGDYSSEDQTDPTGPADVASYRILRGGNWYHDVRYCRVSARTYDFIHSRNYNNGFRLAL